MAWCVDEAVWTFGKWVDNQLDDIQQSFADADTQRRTARIQDAVSQRLEQILNYVSEPVPMFTKVTITEGPFEIEQPPKGTYADPADVFARLKRQREEQQGE